MLCSWLTDCFFPKYNLIFGVDVLHWTYFEHLKKKNQMNIQHFGKVKSVLKGSLDLIPSPSPSVKIQIMGRKVCLRCKGKTLLGVVNKLLKQKKCLHHPALFCLITSSKLSTQQFEFSLKVIGSNPGYLLKSSLL